MELAEGAVVADRFRLVKQLGQGAMGTVWKAQHTGLDIPCAVKFIRPEVASSAEIRERFGREAKAAAQLRSPHVVQILDHGEWEGQPYMAMEFLEGEEMEVRLKTVGRMDVAEVADIVQQVSRALGKAHSVGLVHRDLKPTNIFLVKDGDHQLAKILDFGIVKDVAGDSHTRVGAMMGTPYYMSPEQAKSSRTIDHRADLWSLGVVVYRAVTGQLPFTTGQSMGDLLMKILSAPLPVPSQIAAVPAGFDAWWAKAASRDPAQRFQSAKELADALSALVPAAAPRAAPAQGGYSGAPQGGYSGAPQAGYSGAPQGGYSGAPQGGYSGAPQAGYSGAPQGGYSAPQAGYAGAAVASPQQAQLQGQPQQAPQQPAYAAPAATGYGAPPASMAYPPSAAAKASSGGWWKFALGGLVVLFVIFVIAAKAGSKAAETRALVSCVASPDGAACTVTHTQGSLAGEVCWDVKVGCQNGTTVVGHGCQTVQPQAKASLLIPEGQFKTSGAQRCDRIASVAVENIVVKSPPPKR